MKRAAPVDTMPEFEPLSIETSNLMIEAKSLRAQGELFEAAVKWVDAGRKLGELGTRLLHAGHYYEAAQDVLNSAACFLEAGETPKALDQLRFFKSVKELTGVASENDYIRKEWTSLQDTAKRLNNLLLETWAEMQQLMRDPRGARRLTQKWIDDALRQFPGIQQFHFYAARRYMSLAERTGEENATRIAIDRLRCAAALHREDLDWRRGTIHLRTRKTRRGALVPLPRDAGHAIVEYLRRTGDTSCQSFPRTGGYICTQGRCCMPQTCRSAPSE
jgi:hypothetical protein